MKLLVLAGGFGTRLKTAIADVPKALAPIGGIPFLQFQLENWVSQGLREFTFLLHHQADQIIAFLQAQQAELLKDCQVDFLIEPTPMGTGGAIAHAVKMLDLKYDFLLTNADTWLGGGIHDMMQSAAPTLAVVNLADISRYGKVNFDNAYNVTSFDEKKGVFFAGWVNAGLYHLNVGLFKNRGCKPFSLEHDLFASLVQDCRLTALPINTDFIDIGVPADYYRFCRWVAAGRKDPLCN
jgi:NDP-sugar pyrophosphorylase family protein